MEPVKRSGLAPYLLTTEASDRRPTGNPAAPVDLAGYLGTIAELILAGRSMTGKILLRADIPPTLALFPERAIPLGLIVGVLVTNSAKYAHPSGVAGVLNIGASRRDGAIVVEVSDDGIGLPADFDPLAAENAGLAMVRTLAAQMGASITFDNHGLGLTCRVRLPYAELVADRGSRVILKDA